MTWQQLKAVILLPFTVTVVIPAIILYFTGFGGMALLRPAPWNILILVGAAVLLVVGLVLLATTVTLFAKIGRGTWLRGIPRKTWLWSARTATSAIR